MKETLEKLCPFAYNCMVDYNKSEICQNDYVQYPIYQQAIKYDEKYLKK